MDELNWRIRKLFEKLNNMWCGWNGWWEWWEWGETNIDRQTDGHIEKEKKEDTIASRKTKRKKERKQWGRLERTFEIELRVDRKFNYVFFIWEMSTEMR